MGEIRRETESAIRIAARNLSFVGEAGDSVDEQNAQLPLRIAELTAGDDPDAIDRQSPDFRAGAALALGATLNALLERDTTVTTAEENWTVDPETGRSNSSEAFVVIRERLEDLLRTELPVMEQGEFHLPAQHIVARLAHELGMAPQQSVAEQAQ